MKWRSKLLLLLLVFSVAPMVALTHWSLEEMARTSRQRTIEGLEALTGAKAEALDQFITYREQDVEQIANLMAPDLGRLQETQSILSRPKPDTEELPKLEDAEKLQDKEAGAAAQDKAGAADEARPSEDRAQAGPEETPPSPAETAELAKVRHTLALILRGQQVFEELLVIAPDGRVVASTFGGHEGKSAAELDYFERGMRTTHLQPVFVSPITGELTMVIAAPIRDEDLQQVGVVAARLHLERFFRLINDSTGLGKTGETVAAKKIEDHLVFMAPTRHDAEAALNRKVEFGAPQARALKDAARGQRGSGEHIDYRGKRTLAAWRYVPGLEWGLLVKMDEHEAMASVTAARQNTLILGLGMVVLVVIASVVTSRALVTPLRELKEATDRISRGDFAVQLDIRSSDEIGELADSFERMVAAIKFFREHSRPEDDGEEDVAEEDAGTPEGTGTRDG